MNPVVVAMAYAWREWQEGDDFPFRRDHCINGTRVVVGAMARLGVKARPVSVVLLLFNRPGWELYEAGVPIKDWPAHAWSLGIGPGAPVEKSPGKWNGHLVAEGDDWTLDVSARNFHRPGLIEIDGPRISMRLPEPRHTLESHDQRGNVMLMARWPENNGWRHSPGWRREHTDEIAEITRRTRVWLEKGT